MPYKQLTRRLGQQCSILFDYLCCSPSVIRCVSSVPVAHFFAVFPCMLLTFLLLLTLLLTCMLLTLCLSDCFRIRWPIRSKSLFLLLSACRSSSPSYLLLTVSLFPTDAAHDLGVHLRSESQSSKFEQTQLTTQTQDVIKRLGKLERAGPSIHPQQAVAQPSSGGGGEAALEVCHSLFPSDV